nr:transcription initiation factor IIB [Polyrhizophydium stewartii]
MRADLQPNPAGLVLGNRIIDTRSEWRTFSNSDENSLDPSRVGAVSDPFFGAEGQIDSTAISYRDGGSGRARELSRAHARVVNQKSEAALTQAFRLIHTMGERISLSKVVLDSAKQLFKKADEERTLRSRPLEAVIAACLYIACHEQHVNRTFKEICALTKVSKKEIGKCYKALQHLMEHPAQAATLDSHINRFASLMEMHPEVSRAAVLVTARVTDLGILAGKSPITQVASCLFFVSCMSSDPKPARYIAEVSGCTEPTLKNAYRLLYDSRVELAKDLVLPRGIEALPMP